MRRIRRRVLRARPIRLKRPGPLPPLVRLLTLRRPDQPLILPPAPRRQNRPLIPRRPTRLRQRMRAGAKKSIAKYAIRFERRRSIYRATTPRHRVAISRTARYGLGDSPPMACYEFFATSDESVFRPI